MDLYNGKLYFKCDKCGRDFRAAKYLYRINFEELDTEDFRPFGCLGSQVCRTCWDTAKGFVYGSDKETVEVAKKPEDDWELYLKLKRSGELDGLLALAKKDSEKIDALKNYYDEIKDKYEDTDGIKAKYVKHNLADILDVDREKYG